ncbi:MAG: methyltransferase domain-containing protein, partial [Bradyrhizobium sp.]
MSSGVETRTQEWLAGNFAPGIIAAMEAGPVFGPDGTPRRMSRYIFGRLQRQLKIVRWLDQLEFDSFLDVASGWEHYPFLARERRGAEGFYSDFVHALNVPDAPAYGKQDHSVTLQLPVLPFQDGAFDVVLCSEVFEHLVRPVEAIAELCRVARRYVILTTLDGRAAT